MPRVQLHHLRQQVNRLQQQVDKLARPTTQADSLTIHATAAWEAFRRGEVPLARRELGAFMTEADSMQTLAVEQKDEFLRLAAHAQQALEQQGDAAKIALQNLLQYLSSNKPSEDPTRK